MARVFQIPVLSRTAGGADLGTMELYPAGEAYFREEDAEEARRWDECRWQVREGGEYEYALPEGLVFGKHEAVSPSARKANEGRIRPGNQVGRLSLTVEDGEGREVGRVELECTSWKLTYRKDYRTMLEEVARRSADLLMSSEEHVFQSFETDSGANAETLYQQFAFAKSLVASDGFDAAVGRVCAAPLKAMRTVAETRPAARAGRMGRDGVRQLAAGRRRDALPEGHALARRCGLGSVPHEVECGAREETADVPENRFVKFALEGFEAFMRGMAAHPNAGEGLRAEATRLAERLGERLDAPLFREAGGLDRVPLSSPALQRREGYRELLRAWLTFECAAKLAWGGGEDVYRGGKRNVAMLYEYWAFFKLFDIVSGIFHFPKEELKRLIVKNGGGLELALRQGRATTFTGRYAPAGTARELKAEFTYNKTFGGKSGLETQGSWTADMRPDYTLSIWPAVIQRAEDAEKIDAVVHLHFDAKYKIDKVADIFGERDNGEYEDLTRIKEKEREGTYKRGDLLKMHAYNDAIRRTYGSYVLYPGDRDDPKRRYREIIPGVGAFVLRPVLDDKMTGTARLRDFIRAVAHSLQDRLTQRERTAAYGWKVRRSNPVELPLAARGLALPAQNSRGETFVAAEEPVLVGYVRKENLGWIEEHGYNYRTGLGRGALGVTGDVLRAEYLLLHGGGTVTDMLYRIDKSEEAKLVTKEKMESMGYAKPSCEAYLLLKVKRVAEGEALWGLKCDVARLPGYAGAREGARPFTVMMQDVLLAAVR